ncbi:MAG: S8 family peptidase [Gorillibacterium sp.]|nr:S8 family peptidase [Gorillibacterium sp.]
MCKEYQKNGHRLVSHNAVLGYDVIKVKDKLEQAQQHYNKHSCVKCAELNHYRYVTETPNDPDYKDQYGLRTIKANKAWDTTKGRKASVIAIVDTGVQSNHPDLKGKLLTGYNFVSNNKNTNDDYGHGTHVAGIAAAITNNKVGVAGTAQLNQILPVKSFNNKGTATSDHIIQGIMYAADQGARVINMSFGGSTYSTLEAEACAYALKKGAVLVAAAGNNGNSELSYPGAYPGVISVAATDANNKKASFSSYGKWVTVAAPGVDILSTYPESKYTYLSGTSMATPFVSGLAGLLAAKNRTNTQISKLIKESADSIAGTGSNWQYGLINAQKAVQAAAGKSTSTRISTPYIPQAADSGHMRQAASRTASQVFSSHR